MVTRRICSFCGNEIEPGTGKIFIKRDGTIYNFCTNKCQKNMLGLKRVPRRTRWTNVYGEIKRETKREKEKKKRTKEKKGRKSRVRKRR